MTIAYLIQAHDHYAHLRRLIQSLDAPNVRFYIHIDKRSELPDLEGHDITFIEDRVAVHWGGFSQVQATLNLLKEAIAGSHDYYALISGKDYPIRPNQYLLQQLAEGGEFIHLQKLGEDPFAPLSRYKYYYFTDRYNRRDRHSLQTKVFLLLQRLLRKLRISKALPFPLFTGASWFVLSHDCVNYILKEVQANKKYRSFFRYGFCADESFFQTIIGNSSFRKTVKPNCTFADWTANPGPAFISKAHWQELKTSDKFFARKFTDDSTELIEMIEKELR